MKKIICAVVLAATALALMGLVGSDGNLSWTLKISPYNKTNYYPSGNNRVGNPQSMNKAPNIDPAHTNYRVGYITDVTSVLPDGYDMRDTYPEYDLPNRIPQIVMERKANVYLHFASATPDSGNSLGYFTWSGTPPTDKWAVRETIIFPNTPKLGEGDCMLLGNFDIGTHIEFVIVPNGWNGPPPTSGSSNAIKSNLSSNSIFYSLKELNPEPNTSDGLNAHAVMFWDADSGTEGSTAGSVVVGMEEKLRSDGGGSDHDFSDLLFLIDSDTEGAIRSQDFPLLPDPVDTDGDGVIDVIDEYPNDPARAFNVDGPSGTLAFEDLWPNKGDYDMNDLAVRYQTKRVEDAAGSVKDLEISVKIQARGAGASSGFGIELPGVDPANAESATMKIGAGTATSATPEAGQTNLTWIFFNNSKQYAPDVSGYKYYNTAPGQPPVKDSPVFTLKMVFASAVDMSVDELQAPYNPFIFRTGTRGREVHLMNHPPTALVDPSLFKTGGADGDDSDPESGRYYVNPAGFPWAVNISENWTTHPVEGRAISQAYGDFAYWVSSAGALNTDWYQHPILDKTFDYGN